MVTLTGDIETVTEDNDMDKDNLILQGLVPHHSVNHLCIVGFGDVTMSGSMNPFTNLVSMQIYSCTRLQSLPPLHLLLHLKRIILQNLPCLEWIDNNSNNGNSSSTFFPSLTRIILVEFHNLKGWCRCGEEGKSKDCCHQFQGLDYLCIRSCPNLISVPQHKSIRHIRLIKVNEKILQQAVYLSKVEILWIKGINGLKSLFKVFQHLTSLRELYISNCEELDLCNDGNNCYNMRWKEFTNLRRLELNGIPKMEYPPEGLQHVTTLERLIIQDCPNLRSIPEWITLLQYYDIVSCPNLMFLPEGVKVLQN